MPEDSPHSVDRAGGPARVVVAGGGIAGLEALLALADLAGDRADLTLIAPEPDFTYRPLIVEEPFSEQPAERRELRPIAEELGATLVPRALAGVDPDSRTVKLDDGSELGYDALVICVGARPEPVLDDAITFRSAGESLELARLLSEGDPEGPNRIAFVVPPEGSWPLPIYELALMTQRRVRELNLHGVELLVVTPEEAPLIVFGRPASAAVAELLAVRGIEVRTGARVATGLDGRHVLVPGDEPLEASHVVALPTLRGPAVYGLPADEHGFIPIDQHARVKGLEGVYAAGDGTNFPIKQGGLGTQQADAAAEHIAASLGASLDPQPFHPVLRGMLITGDESLNLKHSLTGGEGEGEVSSDYLWWPPQKVGGRYLSAWLAGETVHSDLEMPEIGLDVEVSLPKEWHEEPIGFDPMRPPVVD
jgi:sulfide:quinone oxidoreductase